MSALIMVDSLCIHHVVGNSHFHHVFTAFACLQDADAYRTVHVGDEIVIVADNRTAASKYVGDHPDCSGEALLDGGVYGTVWRAQLGGQACVMKLTFVNKKLRSDSLGTLAPAEAELERGRRVLQLQQTSPEQALHYVVRILAAGEVSATDVHGLCNRTAETPATAVVMEQLECSAYDLFIQGNMTSDVWRRLMKDLAHANLHLLQLGFVHIDSKLRNVMRDANTGVWKYVDISSLEPVHNLSVDEAAQCLLDAVSFVSLEWAKRTGRTWVEDAYDEVMALHKRAVFAGREALRNATDNQNKDETLRMVGCAICDVVDEQKCCSQDKVWSNSVLAASLGIASLSDVPSSAGHDHVSTSSALMLSASGCCMWRARTPH